MPTWKQALPLVALLATGCGPLAGLFGPPGYRDLGVAHYVGKPLLGTAGEFEALSLAPTRDRVAFAGRESNVRYALFTSAIDGAVRKLGDTGQSPRILGWSADGSRVAYRALDLIPQGVAPLAITTTPTGEAIHVVDVATGADRKVVDVAGMGHVRPDPTLAAALIATRGQLTMVDLATGATMAIPGTFAEFVTTSWTADGQRLYVFDAYLDPQKGWLERLVRLDAPTWRPTEVARGLPQSGGADWRPGGAAWLRGQLTSGGLDGRHTSELRYQEVTTAGEATPPRTIALNPVPAGYSTWHDGLHVSPDGTRLVTQRIALYDLP